MRLNEFNDNDYNSNFEKHYQDASDDDSALKLSDTRKTRLTLLKINKLRKMSDIKKIEHALEMKFIQKMYGASQESSGSDFNF